MIRRDSISERMGESLLDTICSEFGEASHVDQTPAISFKQQHVNSKGDQDQLRKFNLFDESSVFKSALVSSISLPEYEGNFDDDEDTDDDNLRKQINLTLRDLRLALKKGRKRKRRRRRRL